jgi:hypothetical protein
VATRLVVFDTAIVDLTDKLDDPVELLFCAARNSRDGTHINGSGAVASSPVRERPNSKLFLPSR